MKVGIAVQDNFPVGRQIRTKRIAKAADDGGADVVVFARNTRDDPARGSIDESSYPREETLSYAVVRRFSLLSSTLLAPLVTAPHPINPFWTLWLLIQFKRYDIEVAVAGDLRVGLPTILAARALGIPIVFDLREPYAGLARTLPKESPLDYVTQNGWIIATLERATIRLADEVWVVVAERRDRLLEQGLSPDKLTVVSNTPELEAGEHPAVDAVEEGPTVSDNGFDWTEFTLVYVGILNEFRGLDLVLDAVACLAREGDDTVHFAVAGEGPYREALEERCRVLGITDRVTFLGWLDPDRVPAFLASGDIGVIPHRVTPLTEQTVPNKLFDYMSAELPVLTRDVTPIRRIVEETNCGNALPPEATTTETARHIRRLRERDTTQYEENGRKAIEQKYNWDRDAERVRASLARAIST